MLYHNRTVSFQPLSRTRIAIVCLLEQQRFSLLLFDKYEQGPSHYILYFMYVFRRLVDLWHQQHWVLYLSFLENGFGPCSASCTTYRSNTVLMNAAEVLEQRKPI